MKCLKRNKQKREKIVKRDYMSNYIDKKIGERIKALREEQHKTQLDVCKELGWDYTSRLGNIENGQTPLKANEVLSLAKALNTNVNYIITGKLGYKPNNMSAKEQALKIIEENNDSYCLELMAHLSCEIAKDLV